MNNLKRFYPVVTGLTLILFFFLVPVLSEKSGKKAAELTKKDRHTVIKKMIALLKDNYVFPDMGIKVGNHLSSLLKQGEFKTNTDRKAFAKRLTKEMRSVSNDKHMGVRVRQILKVRRDRNNPLLAWHLRQAEDKKENTGFKTVKILQGNVGYLDFRYFGSATRGKAVVAAAMTFLENTDAVIVDMRKNGGGSPQMVALVCSYFFDKKVHLNSLYWRRGNFTQDYYTLEDIDGKRRPDVPLFVLTSQHTFSGAEEFSYNMLTQKRATLVGEVTGGGANPGDSFPINDSFITFIPTGRAINPITKTNWEGTGVKPHIEMDADKAFEKAHDLAKKAAANFNKKKVEALTKKLKTQHAKWEKAVKLYKANKTKENETLLHKVLKRGLDSRLLTESLINNIGYTYLEQKNHDLAIITFSFNTKAFPTSANAYDSLGEAYVKKGDNKLALINYKKSLELDPNNANRRAMIKKLAK